jgi:uncharacterized protein YxjI
MRCPKCAFEQPPAETCARCGVVFSRWRARPAAEEPASLERDEELVHQHVFTHFLTTARRLIVAQQGRHWGEIVLGLEQRNAYDISGDGAGLLGTMVEQGTGFAAAFVRMFFGSHRPLEVLVFAGPEQRIILGIERPLYLLNSTLIVREPSGRTLGQVLSRLSLLYRHYDLRDEGGRLFATIRSPLWRPWTFPVVDPSGVERAVIAKKWSGWTQEYYTDADNFGLDFGTHPWTLAQRAVIFAAMVSIDYDYFENNEGRRR